MARYRVINTITASFFDVFTTNIASTTGTTQIVVNNSDGTVTTIVGTGLSVIAGVAQAGGVVTSITRSTSIGGTTLEIADQLNANNNNFASFWNAPDNAARFTYGTSQGDDGFGSSGVDQINLGIGDNNFTGYQGNDVFIGNIGFDFLSYASEMSAAVAGTQGVIVNMSAASVTAAVTGGTFTVLSNTAKDSYGFTDTFSGMDGASGTSFNDAIYGNATDNTLRGYAGNDFIDGGAGFDEISAMSSTASGIFLPTSGMTVTYTAGTSLDGTISVDGFGGVDTFVSIERIRGTQLVDTFNGNDANNSFRGLNGADILNGGAGFDEANYGQDTTYGAVQGVVVNLSGATLTNVAATGGPFTVAAGTAKDGFGAIDTLNSIENAVGTNLNDYMSGSAWDNSFSGGGANDILIGNDGLDFFTPGGGTDTVNGTPLNHPDQSYDDRDFVSYSDNNNGVGVVVNLSNASINVPVGGVVGNVTVAGGTARDWNGNTDTLIDIERVRGTMSADYLRGSDTANLRAERFRGLGGDDVINGGAGNDDADYSNDDNFGGLAGVTVNLATQTATDGFGNHDTLISIENVVGTDNNDVLIGNLDRNNFRIYAGVDTVDGGDGLTDQVDMYVADIFTGPGATVNLTTGIATGATGGSATLVNIEDVAGSEADDTITGNAQDNGLFGSTGNDVINGLAGADLIAGGPGNNTLDGGDSIDDIVSYMYDPAQGQYFNVQFATDFPTAWTGVTVNLATHTATNYAGGTDSIVNIENVVGTFFNDTITGDAGDNAFDGLSGNDIIDGGGGIDTIYYGRWDNLGRVETLLVGINGSDPNGVTVNLATHTASDGEGGTDTLNNIENVVGSKGVDTITGDDNANRLEGLGGDDILTGGLGADTFIGGAGNDTFNGGGADGDTADYSIDVDDGGSAGISANQRGSVQGGIAGNSVIDGFGNTDSIVGVRNLIGTQFADTAYGGSNDNRIDLGGGADFAFGFDGNDTLLGGAGNDRLQGGLGNDTLDGGTESDTADYSEALVAVTANLGGGTASGADVGSDTLISIENFIGGAGNDSVDGDGNDNTLTGNGGDDAFFGGAGHDTLLGGEGNDTLVGNDVAFLQVSDTLDGGNGNDTMYGEFTDTVSGGAGFDVLYAVNDFAWSLDIGAAGIEYMRAGFGNDTVNAASQASNVEVYGGGGDDVVTGGSGNDFLWGESGNDTLTGNFGNDVLVGADGADNMSGGDGNDSIYVDAQDVSFDGGAGFDAVYLTTGSGRTIDLSATHVEFIADFAGGNDTLNGGALAVDMTSYAGGGTDVITGGSGNDFLWGEAGTDTISGGIGNDVLVGGIGADVLTGGSGIDTIYLNSGGGTDGALDRVVFAAGWGTDFVFDFVHGEDKLDLSSFGTNFAALNITSDPSGLHTYIHIGAGTDLIIVANNVAAGFSAADFNFV